MGYARVLHALQAVGLEARSCSRRARGIYDQDTEALELLNAIADESAAIQGNPPICQGHPWGLRRPPVNASYTGKRRVQCLCRSGLNPTPRTSSTTLLEQPARKNNNNNNKIISFVHSFIRRGWPRQKGGCSKTGMSEASVHPRSSSHPCHHRHQGPLPRPHRCHPFRPD